MAIFLKNWRFSWKWWFWSLSEEVY
jgi:hypothetical protein